MKTIDDEHAAILLKEAQEKLKANLARAHEWYHAQVAKIKRQNNGPTAEEKKRQRYKLALRLRKDGQTFKTIGNCLGVSRNRARDIVTHSEYLERREPNPINELSTRARNGLGNILCKSDFTPDDVALLTTLDLITCPNMGRATIHLIQAWLARHGRSLAEIKHCPSCNGVIRFGELGCRECEEKCAGL